jgi:uncharacterized protein YhhL (DUF1145 family)
MFAIGKVIVAVLWIASARAFFLPETVPWASTGRLLFATLLVVHAIETVVFLPRLRAAGGSLAHHVIQTLLFGLLHAGPLRGPAANGSAASGPR